MMIYYLVDLFTPQHTCPLSEMLTGTQWYKLFKFTIKDYSRPCLLCFISRCAGGFPVSFLVGQFSRVARWFSGLVGTTAFLTECAVSSVWRLAVLLWLVFTQITFPYYLATSFTIISGKHFYSRVVLSWLVTVCYGTISTVCFYRLLCDISHASFEAENYWFQSGFVNAIMKRFCVEYISTSANINWFKPERRLYGPTNL